MSREIKFRFIYRRKDDGHIWILTADLDSLVSASSDNARMITGFMVENDQWELIGKDEFTGLKDADGVEIYEGDILSGQYSEQGSMEKTEMIGPVSFQSGAFRCNAWRSFNLSKIDGNHSCRWMDENPTFREKWYYEMTNIRVIGNIHQHSDLLK